MQSSTKYFAVATLILATTLAGAQISTSYQIGKPDVPVLGLPVTADESIHIVQHLGNGLVVNRDVTGRFARNADGVERYEGTFPSTDPDHPDPTTMAIIVDRFHRTSITLNATRKTAIRQTLPPVALVTVQVLPLKGPGQSIKPENLSIVDLGKKTMGILPISGHLINASIPIGKLGNDQPLPISTELWVAPQLKLIVREIEKNPQFGERTLELSNIHGEEPDPTLFQIPDGYTITDRAPLPTLAGMPSSSMSGFSTPAPEQPTKQMEDALNNPDPVVRDAAQAAEDTRYADIADRYGAQLSGAGKDGESRLAASRAAMHTETAAAAALTAAANVESDVAKATAAAAGGDKKSAKTAREIATADYGALLAADGHLSNMAKELVEAALNNAAFYATNPGNGAINDLAAQDSTAAATLIAAVLNGRAAEYRPATAIHANAIADANTIAKLDPSRTAAFKTVADAETDAQSASTTTKSVALAAAAVSRAATAAAAADGPGNPYAGAVESGASAVANAASATASAQHAMDKLKRLK